MSLSRSQIAIIGLGALVIAGFALLFVFGFGRKEPLPEVNLTIFGTLDNKAMQDLIGQYRGPQPNVKIAYVQFEESGYEKSLLQALAAGRAPDIFMIRKAWLSRHRDKLLSAPLAQFSLGALRQLFPQAVEQTFSSEGNVYALPLTVDTLALFYNKDLFDAKTIATPPSTWEEFMAIIPGLREIGENNRIKTPAAAIGGSGRSIARASDIFNLLLLQSGEPSFSTDGAISFGDKGLEALDFYLSFADPQSEAYTWDDNLSFSYDAFAAGKLPMMFGYAKDIAILKEKNAFLNFGVAPAPQISKNKPVSLPDFYGFAVSKQTRVPSWAWDFIVKAATNSDLALPVSRTLGESPALRTLIQQSATDPAIGVFARQALTARFWPEPDENAVSRIFSDGIEAVLSGRITSRQALEQMENRLNGE